MRWHKASQGDSAPDPAPGAPGRGESGIPNPKLKLRKQMRAVVRGKPSSQRPAATEGQ